GEAGVGHRADSLRVADAHLLHVGVQPKNGVAAAVSGEAGELDLAATGFSREALDGGPHGVAFIAEDDDAAGFGDAVGNGGDAEVGVLKLDAAVELRGIEGTAYRGVGDEGAG